MKAIVVREFGEPDVLKLEDVPELHPEPGQVVVRLKAAGVNPVETYVRKGIYGPKTFPYTPGSDGAGVVASVGAGVTRFKPGDRVYTGGSISGTYAEMALCGEATVHALPDRVSFAQGAAIHVPYATAYHALHGRARPRPGEIVLVHGATGGVGVAAVQLARASGLVVIGTGGTDAGRAMVREQGAQYVLDHHAPDYLDRVVALTDGRGVNVVLEMASHLNLGKDLTVLTRDGRVVVIGSRGPVEINPREAMKRDASILGMTLMNVSEDELARIHGALRAGLEDGSLRPVVGAEVPLADAAGAHERVMSSGALGKIVLVP